MNRFLGEDLGIPKKDIIYGLPIRWWFHCFVCGGPQWKFSEWRDYLLEWEETGLEIFIAHLHNPNPSDKTFLPRTIKILEAHNALTLVGFIKFYLERLKEYRDILDNEVVWMV